MLVSQPRRVSAYLMHDRGTIMLKDAREPSESDLDQVQIYLLGPMLVRIDGKEMASLPKKARALLAYLILRRGVPVPRETILGLLWSERGDDQARASLRQALSLIRKALGSVAGDLIVANRESVTFAESGYGVDLANIAQLSESADVISLSEAVDNIRGELLEGLSLPEPTYEQWLVTEREHIRQIITRMRGQLVHLLEEEGRIDEAIEQSQHILVSDPTAEPTHRALMRLYMAKGRFEAALKQFQKCQHDLRDGLGVEPQVETVELQRRAKAERNRTDKSIEIQGDSDIGSSNDDADLEGHRLLMSCTGMSNLPSRLSTTSEIISARGGQIIDASDNRIFAGFSDTCQALLSSMELRESDKLVSRDLASNIRIGFHAAQYPYSDQSPDPRDRAVVRALEDQVDIGEIDVSEAFFTIARRTSPCHFDDLGEREPSDKNASGRVYRISRGIARHPFQASHVHDRPAPAKRTNSVAVAPITVAGKDAQDQAYLAEGLTEDLILELSRIRRLFVSSRTTVAALSGRDPVEIGVVLGVKFVLSGTVRRSADKVKLSLTLSDTDDGHVVWSDRLNSPFDEFLDLIDEVAARVAGTVGGRIEHEEMAGARLKRPDNMSAYEHYLRGIWHHRMGAVTPEHTRKAVSWLRKSIAADPTFARPRAALACAWSDLPDYDKTEAEKIVEEALVLDPTDPEVHRIMGAVKVHNRDFDTARNHLERAMQMAPNDAYIVGRGASYYSFVGEYEKALELLDRAEALDPFLPVYAVEERLVAEYGLGHYEAVLSEASRLPFQSRRSRYYSAAALKALDREEDARKLMREALAADPTLSREYVLGQEIYRDREFLDNFVTCLHQLGLPE